MKSARSQRRRRGFTIIEMTLAGFLMVVVGVLLSNAWVAFGRPAVSAVARARLAQEANLAAEAISRDIGRLAIPAGPQSDSRYQNVQPAGSTLTLSIDEGNGTIRTISYAIDANDPGKLFRTDSGPKRVVANLVTDFQSRHVELEIGPNATSVPGVQIELTLSHRTHDRDRDGAFRGDHTRRYHLFIPDPQ